jgi:hypothetical protein
MHKGELQKFNIDDNQEVLKVAWKEQTTISTEQIWKDHVDVDKESLERLEEEMFQRSVLAGIAGNYQWGLNAGDHQGAGIRTKVPSIYISMTKRVVKTSMR